MLAALVQEYEATMAQLLSTLGAAERVRLERQLRTLETEMQSLEQRLK